MHVWKTGGKGRDGAGEDAEIPLDIDFVNYP